MRLFSLTDTPWLREISDLYGETQDFLGAVPKFKYALVEPKLALLALFEDNHGLCLAGLTSKEGIRSMLKLVDPVLEYADRWSLSIHGHWKPKTWQANLALKRGFYAREANLYVRFPFQANVMRAG